MHLDNAIKYGKNGGRIKIAGRPNHSGEIEIKIEDSGIGMTKVQLKRLGDVFFRVDESRSDSTSFGLGFAHARGLVRQLGCKIEVNSEIGNCTIVTLTLPK